MSVFADNFSGSGDITDVAYTPTPGPGTWGLSTAGHTFTVSSANRCRIASTGTSAVYGSGTPTSTEYDVEADFFVASVEGTDTLYNSITSHADTGASASYQLRFEVLSAALEARLVLRTGSTVVDYGSVTGAGITAANTYHGLLRCRNNAGTPANLDISAFLTRASDGFYLKSDGTWQAGAIAFATHTDTSPLSKGNGGLESFDFNGDGVGVHFDNFAVSDPAVGGGGAPVGSLVAVRQAVKRAAYY